MEFGEKLTLAPGLMAVADVAALRDHGLTDSAITSIVLAVAYRNFISRVADALGVDLDEGKDYAPEIVHAFDMAGGTAAASRPAPVGHAAATGGGRWIDATLPDADANRLAALRRELEQDNMPEYIRELTLAIAPRIEAMHGIIEFARRMITGGSGLGRRLAAIIGLIVARSLSIPHMAEQHARAISTHGHTQREAAALVDHPTGALASQQERETARFAETLTLQPSTRVKPEDIKRLRAAGFDDRDILTIAAAVSFENFLGRVAAGLGMQGRGPQ